MMTGWTRAGVLSAATALFVIACRDLSIPAVIVVTMACLDRVVLAFDLFNFDKAEIA